MRGDGRRAGAAGICWHRPYSADLGSGHREGAAPPGGPHRRGDRVCAVTIGGQELLASASSDESVRIGIRPPGRSCTAWRATPTR